MAKMVYFDRVATALLAPEAKKAVANFMNDSVGNPSAHIHSAGIAAGTYVDKSRTSVAGLINAGVNEIFFTSGATESNNLALKGFLSEKNSGEIIISEIEHYSILDQINNPALDRFDIKTLKVDRNGLVIPEKLEEIITDETVLVSVIMASPEIGAVQPIKEIARICRKHGVTFHSDATSAVGYIPIDVKGLGLDMMTFSSQTLGGPMGVGALYVNSTISLNPLFDGGNQEMGFRPGTENLPGIVGFGAACQAISPMMADKSSRLTELGRKLWRGIEENIEHIEFTGHRESRLPGHVSFWHRFVEGESLLLHLNMKGVIAASGSACSSNLKGSDEHDLRASHVLTAVGVPEEYCSGSITFSLDYYNSEDEVNYVIDILPEIVHRLEAMSPVYEDYMKQREKHGR
ncbi:MAG: cysteine desulfurase [candidate division Zixibacteria bacterium]|nr:cysteine desulfurase [candidate division Zixibacteria bacterium]